MKRLTIWLLGAACLVAAAACSQAGPGGTGNVTTAGSTGSPGGSTASGGSSGALATAGSSTTGGDLGTSGGATSAGDSGTTAGSAGASTAGASGASTAGAGGTPSAGAGGTSGAGAAGISGAGSVTPQAIVPTLDGLLWVGNCDSGTTNTSVKDCPIHSTMPAGACNSSTTDFWAEGAFQVQKHTVGGTAGAKYTLNLDIRGVTGGKTYNSGTRQSTAAVLSQTANDGWYVGGVPTVSKWNTYEIHVTPPVPGQPVNTQALTCTGCPTPPDNVYYTNSIPATDGVHETFPIKINASFPVLGGGTITLIVHDSNCAGQQNCGSSTDAAAMCTDHRTIDLSGMMPPPPASFSQPLSQINGTLWYPQWLFIDVTSVTAQ